MQRILFLLAVGLCSVAGVFAQTGDAGVTQGTLAAFDRKGAQLGTCPLKHTDVKVEISGFLARARVRQEFENSFVRPIEAVYKFPLPENSAVDEMTMRIGERVIRAQIMKRGEAREVYEAAKNEGKTAALLDQERPNIFTQQVANILPGERITVEISFVETLKYEDGEYEFVFPMTVGERYTPASMATSKVALITPRIARGRAGHDISIEVNLNAGVPVESIRSTSHEVETVNFSSNAASVKLKNERVIPNKDFILRYDVTGGRIENAVLTHNDPERGGFFALILSPPEKMAAEDITPKEIVFLLDVSGSMGGFPIEKAKEAMRLSLDNLNQRDTFNLITFAGETEMLFDKPVPATAANLRRARTFLATLNGGGGTEMMKAIRAALTPSDAQDHIRIVCFMTDGYVGNDMEIVGEVERHPNARVFAFGIGNSVNRFLLDKVSEAGRGEVEYVSLEDDGSKAARKFYERVRSPLLTDISIDWNSLPVSDVYPRRIPDLFSAKPVVIYGRYPKAGKGKILLRGNVGGQQLVREIPVNLPETESGNDVLATLWARKKIDDLMLEDWAGTRDCDDPSDLEKEITKLGLDFRLLTQYTSFVAVEEQTKNLSGRSVRVDVPSENPEGVRTEIIQNTYESPAVPPPPKPTPALRMGNANKIGRSPSGITRTIGNSGGGTVTPSPPPKTISGGVINGKAIYLPQPAYPAAARAVGAKGAVSVQVFIDESGNVTSCKAVSGHPLLRVAAERAARRAKFAPVILSGQPVKVSGVITYVFGGFPANIETSLTDPAIGEPPLTPEMRRRSLLEEKLDPQILNFVDALEKTSNSKSVEADFLRDGKARIEVWLNELTPEVREKLSRLGFVFREEKQGKILIGRIAPDKLAELAEIAEVQYVLPKIE
ncbi:MAG: TonB family protein [Pyrinomonadaceae bacterium]